MSRVLLLATLFAAAFAVPKYRQSLPNPNTTDVCPQQGHGGCTPGNATVNQLGLDFRAAGYQYTVEFCKKDSDGDGVSNGAELGDPCCVWKRGDTPARTTDISNAGDPNSKPKPETDIMCKSATAPAAAPGTAAATSPAGPTPAAAAASSASPSASPAASNSSDPVCFPADATVSLMDGTTRTMETVRIGDMVQVADGQHSEVFMFTHRLSNVMHPMVALTTASGATIELTAGHHLYVDGRLQRADSAALGSTLQLLDGSSSAVVDVKLVQKRGLYNPQTRHGDIVVAGIKSSTYTDAIQSCAAHAALSPLRALFAWLGLHSTALESGLPRMA